jgi:hypothetical protein
MYILCLYIFSASDRTEVIKYAYNKGHGVFLIENFRHVLDVVCFLLGCSPAYGV